MSHLKLLFAGIFACGILLLAAAGCIGVAAPAAEPDSPSASPPPPGSSITALSLSEVPFAIDGHTTILPPQDTDNWKFRYEYGTVTIPEGKNDLVFLTFDKPVASFDDVIALDFTIYGEPYHRILKKTNFNLYSDIITYEGRIDTRDPATVFWITFGPGNLVHTDFPWNKTTVEVIPVQNLNSTEKTTHPLHIAYRQPGWDELMQNPEFANSEWVIWRNEEKQKYADDPNYKPDYYWEYTLANTFGMENDPGSTTVRFTEEDFQQVPEFREFLSNPKAKIRLSLKIYEEETCESIYSKFTGSMGKRVFIEIDGKYYQLSGTTGMVTPWDP